MSTITLKNVPLKVHRALRARARAHGRSLNKEILVALESTEHAVPVDASAVLHHARAVRETAGVYMTQADLGALKRAGRR